MVEENYSDTPQSIEDDLVQFGKLAFTNPNEETIIVDHFNSSISSHEEFGIIKNDGKAIADLNGKIERL